MSPRSTPDPVAHRVRSPWRSTIARVAVGLGALSVLATGVAHLQQYYSADYSTVPTIGPLFLLNFVSATILAVGLVAPLGRVAGRYADAVRALFAAGGIGIAVLSLAGLFISESSGLFGFVEHGYRTAIVLAIVAEVAARLPPDFPCCERPARRSGRRMRRAGLEGRLWWWPASRRSG